MSGAGKPSETGVRLGGTGDQSSKANSLNREKEKETLPKKNYSSQNLAALKEKNDSFLDKTLGDRELLSQKDDTRMDLSYETASRLLDSSILSRTQLTSAYARQKEAERQREREKLREKMASFGIGSSILTTSELKKKAEPSSSQSTKNILDVVKPVFPPPHEEISPGDILRPGESILSADKESRGGRGRGLSSNIHKIINSPSNFSMGGSGVGKKAAPMLSTGEASAQNKNRPKSIFQRLAEGDYKASRLDSKEMGDFLFDVREQLLIAKKIAQQKNRFIDDKKSFRLKRDYRRLKTIMLDLDETLIHSEDYLAGQKYDYVFEMDNPGSYRKEVGFFDAENRSLLSAISI